MARLELLLASTSPRRSRLLAAAGLAFRPIAPGPEIEGHGSPRERAEQRAASKALGAPPAVGLVLGVDTVVDLDGEEFGQADSPDAARAMLERLAGRDHLVHTGHCLVRTTDGARFTELTTAAVRFLPLDAAALDRYVASGLWRGKAGAYGIQDADATFARLVRGDLDTVVGLSVRAVRTLLARAVEP